jgi:hypothetical protein
MNPIVSYVVFMVVMEMCHPSQYCPLLLDGYQCFKCLGSHPKVDCHNSIWHSPDNCPKCHLSHEIRYGVNYPGQIRGE